MWYFSLEPDFSQLACACYLDSMCLSQGKHGITCQYVYATQRIGALVGLES